MQNPPAAVEYTGGPPAPKQRRRLPFFLLSLATIALLLVTGVLLASTVFRDPLRQLAARAGVVTPPQTSMDPEPSVTHAFVQAAAKGDGPAMRRQITEECMNDQGSALCFDASVDAAWQKTVQDQHPRFTFVGAAGDLVGYSVELADGSKLEIVFRLDPRSGLIAAQRVI
jgi:hypothetical protein